MFSSHCEIIFRIINPCVTSFHLSIFCEFSESKNTGFKIFERCFLFIAFVITKYKKSNLVLVEKFLTWPFYELWITKSTFTKTGTSMALLQGEDHLNGKIIFLCCCCCLNIIPAHLLLSSPPGPWWKLPAALHLVSPQSVLQTLDREVFSKPKPAGVSLLLLWLPIVLTSKANSLSWTSLSCKAWPPWPRGASPRHQGPECLWTPITRASASSFYSLNAICPQLWRLQSFLLALFLYLAFSLSSSAPFSPPQASWRKSSWRAGIPRD